MKLVGKVHKYGDHVDTDVIIPGRYLEISDPQELGKHCMEDIDPDFVKKVRPGDIMVAEKNFGSGSSREHAPVAIKASGVACVIAKSFARIFFRNALNIGLPVLVSEEAVDGTEEGDTLEVNLAQGEIVNLSKKNCFRAEPYPGFIVELISAGGLVEYTRRRLLRPQNG
ncbi:MAG: 3-isopropylmalate dehydratase small subunit [Deltaproteobacteria bacterium RBG_16_48_10]|nr:MAG: 3-isopropylmalate dehydratase small subunit [Deltaproteobacteria bacterium RBG_16_48_10]